MPLKLRLVGRGDRETDGEKEREREEREREGKRWRKNEPLRARTGALRVRPVT